MLLAWRQACAASGRHTSLSLRQIQGSSNWQALIGCIGKLFRQIHVIDLPFDNLRADEGNVLVAGLFCDTLSEFTLFQLIFLYNGSEVNF